MADAPRRPLAAQTPVFIGRFLPTRMIVWVLALFLVARACVAVVNWHFLAI